MGLFTGMETSASGLTTQRLALDLIANNIANINSTRTGATTAAGNQIPYRRQVAVLSPVQPKSFGATLQQTIDDQVGQGVQASAVVDDASPFPLEYNPSSPDAAKVAEPGLPVGYVRLPNVNIVTEMSNMITASRAYEANVTALNASKDMATKALEIGRG